MRKLIKALGCSAGMDLGSYMLISNRNIRDEAVYGVVPKLLNVLKNC